MATVIYAVFGIGAIAFFIIVTVVLERLLGRKSGNGLEHSIDHYLSEVDATKLRG